MLPSFPTFAPLSLAHRAAIEAAAAAFPPYSDFSFICLWSWDLDGQSAVAKLHGNLVLRLTDYLSGEPFLTSLGTSCVDDAMCVGTEHRY